jgi:hypothetical protein
MFAMPHAHKESRRFSRINTCWIVIRIELDSIIRNTYLKIRKFEQALSAEVGIYIWFKNVPMAHRYR